MEWYPLVVVKDAPYSDIYISPYPQGETILDGVNKEKICDK
jgi:hypothetical protein